MKLQEIPDSVVTWFEEHGRYFYDTSTADSNSGHFTEIDAIDFVKKVHLGSAYECIAELEGVGGFNPPIQIDRLFELKLNWCTLPSYSKLPKTGGLEIDNCTLGPGFVEYVRTKTSRAVSVRNSKLPLEDVIQLVFGDNEFVYMSTTKGSYLRVSREIDGRHFVSLYKDNKRVFAESFDDEFDMQEFIMHKVDVSKWFKV